MVDDLEQPGAPLDSVPAPNAGTSEPTDIESEDGLPEGQHPDPDEIEDELEGVKLRGKKELLEKLKSERLMQADYTRKTQEVAEQRRTIEREREQVQQTAQTHQQNLRDYARLVSVDERLEQFQQLNWQQVNADDPQRAQALLIEFNQLQSLRGQLANSLTQRQQQQALQTQQDTARRLQEGQAVLTRDIKGWSPQMAKELADFAVSSGVPEQLVSSISDPAVIKLLHKANLFDKLEKQKTAKPAVALPKPVTRVGGASAANTKPLGEVTDPREWAERRRQRKVNNR